MKKISLQMKIGAVCLLAVCIAGIGAFAGVRQKAGVSGALPEPAASAAVSASGVSQGAAAEPLSLSAGASGLAETSSVVQTTASREDLMEDISFVYEEETLADEMGRDFAIGNFKPAGGKVTRIGLNMSVKDALYYQTDCRAYSFTLEERGVVSLNFEYRLSEVSGTPWIVYLYEHYSRNGSGEADSFRLITKMEVGSTETKAVKSENIGLYPGSYYIVVAVGSAVSVDEYTLSLGWRDSIAWEAEPNDSQNRYSLLSFGVRTGGSCSDKTGGDQDWFLIQLPERGVISLKMEHSDLQLPQVGWFVTLLNREGDILYQARSYYKDTLIDSGEIGLSAGEYFVRVTPHILSSADYYLTCSYEAIDTYETETNDTPQTADILPLTGENTGVSGSLSDKNTLPDIDYYRFEPDRAGVISFTFIHQDYIRNRDGWTIRLLDENGKELYSTVSRWCDMAVYSPQIGLDAGVYYIAVDSENMLLNSGTYIIGISYAPADNWETEDNNSRETADVLPVNTAVSGTLITTADEYDIDYFTFTLKQPASVSFLFEHNGLAENYEGWIVGLYNEKGEKITGFSSKWSDVQISSELMRLPAGKYYICVETGARFTDEKYSITVKV